MIGASLKLFETDAEAIASPSAEEVIWCVSSHLKSEETTFFQEQRRHPYPSPSCCSKTRHNPTGHTSKSAYTWMNTQWNISNCTKIQKEGTCCWIWKYCVFNWGWHRVDPSWGSWRCGKYSSGVGNKVWWKKVCFRNFSSQEELSLVWAGHNVLMWYTLRFTLVSQMGHFPCCWSVGHSRKEYP